MELNLLDRKGYLIIQISYGAGGGGGGDTKGGGTIFLRQTEGLHTWFNNIQVVQNIIKHLTNLLRQRAY